MKPGRRGLSTKADHFDRVFIPWNDSYLGQQAALEGAERGTFHLAAS